MKRLRWYDALVLLVLLLPLSTWLDLAPGHSRQAVAPPPLPQLASVKADGLLESMLAHNLWDKARGRLASGQIGSATTVAVTICRLKGVAYGQLQAPQAMFDCDSKLILLHEGDTLPDKSLLNEIHADHVVVQQSGNMRELYLFGKKNPVDKIPNHNININQSNI